MHKLIITRHLHPAGLRMLREEFDITELVNPSKQTMMDALPGVQAVIANVSPRYDGDLLDHAPDLVVVARHGVGMDNVDLDAHTRRGICVLWTPDAMRLSVAEHTVGLMLSLSRCLDLSRQILQSGEYTRRHDMRMVNLRGKTLGIIGCGRIGGRVAEICSGSLGMKVIVYDPYIPAAQAADVGAELWPSLGDVLAASDVVSLHVPLTAETQHMISRQQLAQMKRSAYLINCARGPVVDEPALVAALRAGRIAGAGIDVFEEEPPSADNPLFHMPNVAVTPHSAGSAQECLEEIATTLARDLHALMRGIRPTYLANPEVWERRRPLPAG